MLADHPPANPGIRHHRELPTLLVVDAQQLLKSEAEVAASLVGGMDGSSVVAVFVSEGALPAPLNAAVKEAGFTDGEIEALTQRGAIGPAGNGDGKS